MTNPVFNPDDPRLTAFVLGEIDDSDRAAIEQLLETSPEAQAVIKEIGDTIDVLRDGLASEPVPALTADQRAIVEQHSSGAVVVSAPLAAASAVRVQRPRARFAKLAGFVASISVLALTVALILPAGQQARDASMSSIRRNAEKLSQLVAASTPAETEESFAYSDQQKPGGESASRRLDSADEFKLTGAGASARLGDGRVSSMVTQNEPLARPFGAVPGSLDVTATPVVDGPEGAANTVLGGKARPARKESDDYAATANPATSAPSPPSVALASKDKNSPGSNSSLGKVHRQSAQSPEPLGQESGDRRRMVVNAEFEPTAKPGDASGPQSGGETSKFRLEAVTKSQPAPTNEKNGPAKADGTVRHSNVVVAGRPVADGSGGAGPKPVSGKPADQLASRTLKTTAPSQQGLSVADVDSRKGSLQPVRQPAAESSEAETLQKVQKLEAARGKLLELQTKSPQEEAVKLQIAAVERLTEELKPIAHRMERERGVRDLEENLREYRTQLGWNSGANEQQLASDRANFGTEAYDPIVENDFIVPVPGDKEKALSTISIDVDTASYANMRRFLIRDQLPPANSVRIEELVNYFKYDYAEPEGNEPFSVKTELAPCPWQRNHRLAMVGLKAKTIDKAQRPPTNLVYLLDVSGSMRASNKLPLVQQSMRLLVEEMTEDDRIAIVTYASNAGLRLDSTPGSKKADILKIIDGLQAGGSTNGEGGIKLAYDVAIRNYFQGGANRVILCTDGDFNVGVSSDNALVELIQEKAASGVFLSVFGFGMGNLKDAKLEKLADKGNGHYGYIDNLNEARKVFQDELVGTLYTIAKDVKLQVEFNPATVGAYRLIGYENRKLAAQDFTDDTKDAGEIGSGHTVTALYEIIPKHLLLEQPGIDGLKYQAAQRKRTPEEPPVPEDAAVAAAAMELFTVKLRYKKPDEESSVAIASDYPVQDIEIPGKALAATSDDLMFAASVASFGMNLRGSQYRGNWGFAEVLETVQGSQSEHDAAQRAEFVQLVQRAMRITGQQTGPEPPANVTPIARPGELDSAAARIKASVDGKYRRLVTKIEVRDDFQRFGAFNDYGHWDGTEYAGHKDLPPGNWVYVYPNWYIWAEATVPPVEDKPEDK